MVGSQGVEYEKIGIVLVGGKRFAHYNLMVKSQSISAQRGPNDEDYEHT